VGPDPHGKVSDFYMYGPDLRVKSRTSTGVPGPLGRVPDPLCRARATHSKDPGFQDKEYPGLDQGQVGVQSQHVSGLGRVRSLLRRRPNAATWLTVRDVSQRVEPDVRLLGRASSAFIAGKTRRLIGDVPPRHLMCHVHFAGRDVLPRHLMCLVHSAGRR
jgi:hypothetical protein